MFRKAACQTFFKDMKAIAHITGYTIVLPIVLPYVGYKSSVYLEKLGNPPSIRENADISVPAVYTPKFR